MKRNTDYLKSQLLSADWKDQKSITNLLFEDGEYSYLLELFQHEDSSIRNSVALTFKEHKYQEALDPIFKAVQTEAFRNSRGTLIFALQSLNCSHKLNELYNILFSATNNWEVQNGVLSILDEQEFEFTAEELLSIESTWKEVRGDWNRNNGIQEEKHTNFQIDEKTITEVLNGFLSHLNTEDKERS
ncbi:hypothetical protein [Reichenbachiella sp.]|uniref:hypothetical protein n=1 Tax=Reichenbachiella sp. TaxID=2184521 RepID=UPI003B59A13D